MLWLTPRILGKMFGKDRELDDNEYVKFVSGVMVGSDFECKCWGDFCEFQGQTGFKSKKLWKAWFAKYKEDGSWPVCEKSRWCYFKDYRKVSEWEDYY